MQTFEGCEHNILQHKVNLIYEFCVPQSDLVMIIKELLPHLMSSLMNLSWLETSFSSFCGDKQEKICMNYS